MRMFGRKSYFILIHFDMVTFWVLWGFDAVITLVVLYFFMIGLGDGTVSSDNMGLWTGILLALAAIMGGSLWLKNTDHMALAKLLLWILAVPGLLYVIFLLVVVMGKSRWN